jgi:hypothetical protein
LAPDTECSEALDDKVDLIIAEANSREVPIAYCLSRRRIGKAVGLSMRQSAVCVYDASGAHDLFKKIVQFVNFCVDTGMNISPGDIGAALADNGQQVDASHSMDVLSRTTLAPASGGDDGGTDEGPEDEA